MSANEREGLHIYTVLLGGRDAGLGHLFDHYFYMKLSNNIPEWPVLDL